MIDGPITSVKLFPLQSVASRGMQTFAHIPTPSHTHCLFLGTPESAYDYHLLVGSAIELGAVFL